PHRVLARVGEVCARARLDALGGAPIPVVVFRALGHTDVPDSPDAPASALRENALAVRTLTPGMLARAQAYLFAAAGVLGFVGVLLPHPAGFDVLGLVALQAACLVSAGVLLALGERTPGWVT